MEENEQPTYRGRPREDTLGKDHAGLKTSQDYVAKFRQVLHSDGGPDGVRLRHDGAVDWMALFLEWIKTDVTQYPNIRQFVRSKGVHPGSLQKRGGRMFWNQARESVRIEAMAKAMAKAPDAVAKRLENLGRVQDKLERAIEKVADRVLLELEEHEEATGDVKADRQERREKSAFNARLLETLKDVQGGLTDIRLKLAGDTRAIAQPAQGVNLLSIVFNELNIRDKKHGVIDAEAERPPS